MAYLQGLARSANKNPTAQRTLKCGTPSADTVNVQFEPMSMDETKTVNNKVCEHEVWMEPAVLGRKQICVKLILGRE
jgi:hypothetical protein